MHAKRHKDKVQKREIHAELTTRQLGTLGQRDRYMQATRNLGQLCQGESRICNCRASSLFHPSHHFELLADINH